MNWHEEAACRGRTDLFYLTADTAPRGRHAPNADPWAHARALCDTCPVPNDCLKDVIETGDTHGFRAGHDPDALDRIIRSQGGTIAKTCDWCGDPYTAQRRESNRRYCGSGCAKAALRKVRREYNRRARGTAA